jgi:dTDP-4-dehydrorhamnose reductase
MDGLVVVGGAGRLATALRSVCPTARMAPRRDLDVTDPESIAQALDRLEPAAVINTAAVADVDRCEADPDLAFAVNAHGAGNLARRCAQLGVPLIHISTDYVFGAKEPRQPFTENDPTDPLSAYGRSKVLGETLLLEAAPLACVARVAWLFGHEADFLHRMLRQAVAGAPLPVFRQTSSPTPIVGLARQLVALAASMRAGVAAPPILHLAGGPPASRRAWLTPALQAYQAAGGGLGCEIVEIEAPAIRPSFSVLDVSLSATIVGAPLDWRQAAARTGASFRA